MNPCTPNLLVVPSISSRVLKLIAVKHKLLSQQTWGSHYLFEAEFDPESGNRLHAHAHEDEVVYFLLRNNCN